MKADTQPPRLGAARRRRVDVLVDPVGGATRADAAPRRHAMTAEDGGWWSWTRPDGGTRLRLLPRRRRTPDPTRAARGSPHGRARRRAAPSTPGRIAWADDDWRGTAAACSAGSSTSCTSARSPPRARSTPRSSRLDHLVDLGVDVVELMPVAAFGGTHGWGYDGVARYAVHEAYGGPAALQRFVDACHARGLGVCLDVVYNHLGPTGNYLPSSAPTSPTPTTPVGAGGQPRRRRAAHEVRRWVLDNALRWFRDFHVDALRLDAVHALRRRVRAAPARGDGRRGRPLSQRSSDVRSTSSPRATSTTPSW